MAPEHGCDGRGRDRHEEVRAADGVGRDAADDEGDDREVRDLRVVREERREARVVEEPVDRSRRLGSAHREQRPEQVGGGRREAELAAEREPEPETGPLVPEELTQVEAMPEAAHRVEDPQRPHGEDEREQPLVPRTRRARAPRS